ncbi:integrin alpha-L-like isoform X2 [Larus michahellis]|uniref:integrin alpha-L-like isoform X2 n=1 Tax=Larus michahellis TaxID=119627 RepID=UPI003D9BE4F8
MAGAGVLGVAVGLLVAALPHIGAFNIHPAPYRILTHNDTRSFGHRVLQLNGSRLVVGAPAEAGEGGRLFQCRVETGECRELELEGNSTQTHMGMALARDGDVTIACGPGFTRECDRNVYSSGICLLLDPQLRPRRVLAPGYQGCLLGMVDLVFLFDGSSSLTGEQFGAIRDFMVDVMEKLGNSSIRFGAVQFSDGFRCHFSLGDFAARPRPRELLRDVRQRGGLTDTFAAIRYVVREIFTPERGARAGAKRVLILITDGDATDTDNGSVREAEERDITRYIIGVGNNFGTPDTRLYLSQFASSPSSEFVKVLDSFEKLRHLFRELQAKIYAIEGTSDLNRFHLELCSSGMSLEVAHGRRVTGAVGADNWAGGLVELEEEPGDETFVASPSLEENVTDTYLGYAVAGLRVPGRALVAAGAPRHRHLGAVVLFEVPRDAGSWRVLQTLPGEQVGSYFGATLSALDQGGATVALLVGAPHYYDGRRGGRVLLYRWQKDALEGSGELWGVPGHPLGRFGASLGTLGDLDGDGLAEVAVGAPLEDDDRGAVYVFFGRPGGLEPHFSQRLEGRGVAPGLRFFGQALDGAMDLTGDGLADMAVGTEGHVVVLRSRPVLRVTPLLTFDPPRVPPRGGDCSGLRPSPLRLSLCLRHAQGAPVTPVTFVVEVEPQRARGRGSIGGGRRWAGEVPAGEGPRCQSQELLVPPCLEDFVTPIRVAVTLSLPHSDPPGPILPPNTPPTWIEIPFQQNCGADEVCEADLWVRALPSGAAVVGVPGAELGLRLTVGNAGEDAYGAALQVRHPPGLSFRRARATQDAAPVSVNCWAPEAAVGQPWVLTCNISRPVLRAGWQVTLELTFDILQNATWGETVGLRADASSDNEPHAAMGNNGVSWDVPVRFALSLVATWQDDSTPYLNFSSSAPQPRACSTAIGWRPSCRRPHGSPPAMLTAFVLLPHTLPHNLTVLDPQVTMEPGGACVAVGQEEVEGDAVGQELNQSITKGCFTPRLRLFRCPTAPLPRSAAICLRARLRPSPTPQGPARPRFCSALWLRLAPPPL